MGSFFIIGHRGAVGEKFENSLSGFEYALTLDIDAIETAFFLEHERRICGFFIHRSGSAPGRQGDDLYCQRNGSGTGTQKSGY